MESVDVIQHVNYNKRTERKRERNKKRRRNIRSKRKEKLSQVYVVSKELDDKKKQLAQTRCKLVQARKIALELSRGQCKAPTTSAVRRCNSITSVSSLQHLEQSRPTASSGLRTSHNCKLFHHTESLGYQVRKLDSHSLRNPYDAESGDVSEVGSGTFGKCMKMILSATEVAVKSTTLASYSSESIMYEAAVMSEVCNGHPNLPLFIGVCDQPECPKPLLVIKFYSVSGEACTLHRYLKKQLQSQCISQKELQNWARLLVGVCNGLEAIHHKGYLHNDLKCDNIVLSDCKACLDKAPSLWPVIIDFGKARPIKYPRKYKLTEAEKTKYLKAYTHLAPELVKGLCPQSESTDMYSLGHIIRKAAGVIASQHLKAIGKLCTKVDFANRPSIVYVRDSISELA